MAEGAASREGSAPPDAAGSEDDPRVGPDATSGDCVAAAPGGRWRDRRSGVALPGAAGPPADSEAALLEAARATPRRSSIIKNPFHLLGHFGSIGCVSAYLEFMTIAVFLLNSTNEQPYFLNLENREKERYTHLNAELRRIARKATPPPAFGSLPTSGSLSALEIPVLGS